MVEQPAGVVTLFFSDIEGSTRLLHELGPERYREALGEHRRVMRDAFARHGGYEVDYEGDAFFVAFGDAAEAVAAASEAQAALGGGPIVVRMGLHTGEPLLDPPKYIGVDVHLAARIMSAGHGGQVLLSRATRELVDAEATELGEHRLKDIELPVPLFQLGDGSFPPLKTISNTNLPRPASSFVGREAEVAEVVALVRESRLVTLTGPGGTGKTRLAIEAAAELVPEFKAGVFWVGLATLRDPGLVTETIAQTLGAKGDLAEHVGERELLLLLDNFEQVVDAAPELSTLLEACANLRLLVTSRELLRIQGEVEYPVLPLAGPDAVELFRARSRIGPDDTVAELCRRLDDLPLAVELAAARTAVLTPAQILERLGQRLDLLKGGRDADPRQQTLRATIEWSHDLLDEDEQRLFAHLAVFVGGCTLDAAEDVCDADLDTLQSLVDKSLVRRTGGRFWMLETIREYASERLSEAAGLRALHERFRDWYVDLARRLRDPLRLGGVREREQATAEIDNFRSVLARADSAGDSGTVALLVATLWVFWLSRGDAREGLRWGEKVVANADTSSEEMLVALNHASELLRFFGDAEACGAVKRTLIRVYEQTGDLSELAPTMSDLASLEIRLGHIEEARRLAGRALEIRRELGQPLGIAHALGTLGDVEMVGGDPVAGARLHEEALPFAAAAESRPYLGAFLLLGLAQCRRRAGEPSEAARSLGKAINFLRALDHRSTYADLLQEAAALASDQAVATRLLAASERVAGETGAARFDPDDFDRSMTRARAALGDDFGAAWEKGFLLEDNEALALALSAID